MSTKKNDTAELAFKEMRAGLEMNLTALQAWHKRTEDEALKNALQKRIDSAEHALNAITSTSHTMAMSMLSEIGVCDDRTLITALYDIINWDNDMKDLYGSVANRAELAIKKYNEGLK